MERRSIHNPIILIKELEEVFKKLSGNLDQNFDSQVILEIRKTIDRILYVLQDEAYKEEFHRIYSVIPKEFGADQKKKKSIEINDNTLNLIKNIQKDISEGHFDSILYSEKVPVIEKILTYQINIDEKLLDYDIKYNTLFASISGAALVLSLTSRLPAYESLKVIEIFMLIGAWLVLLLASFLGICAYLKIYELLKIIQNQFSFAKSQLTDPAIFVDMVEDYQSSKESEEFKKCQSRKDCLLKSQKLSTFIGLGILSIEMIISLLKLTPLWDKFKILTSSWELDWMF